MSDILEILFDVLIFAFSISYLWIGLYLVFEQINYGYRNTFIYSVFLLVAWPLLAAVVIIAIFFPKLPPLDNEEES